MNEAFTEVLSAAELPIGRIRAVKVDDRTIAISHTAGGFFATDNTCPHRGGPLAEGDLIGDEIVCPWHLWGFNLQTGICDGNRDISIVTHEVRVEDDRILVRLSPARETTSSLL
jgi:NAD(P)H-dependent nitrite reductase small subunit